MGSLSKCLKKAGLSQHEAAILKGAAGDYMGEGKDAHLAAVTAVMDHIEDLLEERAGIEAQITKHGGVATMAPFAIAEARAINEPAPAAETPVADSAQLPTMETKESENVTDERSGTDLERNSQDAETSDGMGAQGVSAERGGNGGPGKPGMEVADSAEGERGSGDSLRDGEAAATGERGNLEIYTGATELTAGAAGNRVDLGSGDGGLDGLPVEPDATNRIADLARSGISLEASKLKQQRADKEAHTAGGLAEIRAALPILTEGQQEDVHKTEQRFAVSDGYGMLFTNGTGTGKTFSALGVIKRFANAGKKDILVVAPSREIIDAWQKAGKLLGLDLTILEDTNDAGKGIVITTYANMGQNNELAKRDWDMVVHDEAHYLAMDKNGTNTNALKTLRAISLHPEGVFQRHAMMNAEAIERLSQLDAEAKSQRTSDDQHQWYAANKTQADADKLRDELKAKQDAIKADVAGRQLEKRTRVLFLSATPFAYEKTVDWANGYIFDYNEGRASEEGSFRGYNQGSNRDQFMMQHFGYRMRTGKLTEPDAKVDRGLMQRQFNSWLKKKGSLSGRMLDVAADYDRRFILVDSAIGQRIDEALQWFEVKRKAQHAGTGATGDRIGAIMAQADPYAMALNAVRDHIGEKFDYLSRRYLLESIKAREVVPHVREHLAMGRKVVVFHDYKKGGGFNPFIIGERAVSEQEAKDASVSAAEWNRVVKEFNAEFKDIINSDLFRQSSPIDMFKSEFPNVLLFNGDIPAKQRRANVQMFQDDASGPQVILVQSAAGKEGISLHDTTGKHQRALFNLGQPTQPTTAIQQEGRIYRTGQVTDAIIRYLNTGTNWEKWAFATTIAQRASAAENLGMGELARSLKDAFISGFEESGDYRAGMEGEGKGGKERDKAANDALTEYDRARAFYFGTQKKTSKTKAQEGADYFATPEPVGLKMVEWADIRPGEHVLEPSAGHGAIARWIPEAAEKTAIEPSMTLRPRLAMVFDGKILDHDFEELNVVNKYDAIVMNPPFGSGGKTAVDHLAKAATHLRDGGRIVALLPTGPAADKKFDHWMYGEEERKVNPLATHPKHGPIYRGDTVSVAGYPSTEWIAAGASNGLITLKSNVAGISEPLTERILGVQPTGKRSRMMRLSTGFYTIADVKMPAVTFERAGTQVMTRIIVIEKSADPQAIDTRGAYNRDFSNAEDINELFDRLEDMALPMRAKEPEVEEQKPAARKAKPVVDSAAAEAAAQAAGLEVIEHTTGKGKILRGVVRTDLSRDQAKAIDEFTFKKDGGWFIREKHLVGDARAKFSRADLPSTQDIGKVGDWNKEVGFSPIPSEDLRKVKIALVKARLSGIPESVTDRIKVITGAVYVDDRRAGYNVATGRLVIGQSLMQDDPATFLRTISHEVGHAIDFEQDGQEAIAVASSHPDMVAVIQEAQSFFDKGGYDDILWYPLDSKSFQGVPIEAKQQELFAQLVGLYVEQKGALKANLPLSFKFIERAINEPETVRREARPSKSWVSLYTLDYSPESGAYRFVSRSERRGPVQANTRIEGLDTAGRSQGSGAQSGEVDPKLKRAGVSDARILSADLKAVVDTFRKEFSGVQVITVERESQLPDSLQSDIADAGAEGEVAGAFHKGAIYLVQDNLRDLEHAQDTLMHEAEHAGLSGLFGKSIDPVMLDIWKSNLKVQLDAKKIKDKYGYAQVRAIEEALAEMGPKVTALKGWDRLVSLVRAKLRKLGWVKEWTDKDVEALVLRALSSLKSGGKTNLYRGSALSRDQEQTDSVAFRKWFGDSKVVDADGNPLVVYKGMPSEDWETGEQITEIRSKNGPWAGFFSSDKTLAGKFAKAFGQGGIVVPAYISMTKPFVVDAKGGYARDFMFDASVFGKKDFAPARAAIESGDYDGVIIKNTADEGDVYVPKNPAQIKSAIGNSGAFDPRNPDIRMSRTENEGLAFANEFLTELSYEDAAFRHAVSNSRTLEGNILDALPGAEYLGEDTRPDERDESMADQRFVFAMPTGRIFYVYSKGKEVWIDVSRLQPGDNGGAVYHGVANYAFNTGNVFVGDPNGLSDDAIVRRTSAMLSSALRFGTTSHFEAAKEQIKGVKEKGIEPLDWRGDDLAKTKALIHTFVTTLQNQFPEIKNYRYDFTAKQFIRNGSDKNGLRTDGGEPARGDRLEHLVGKGKGALSGTSHAGYASLRRGVLIQSLASSESDARPGLLEAVLNGSVQLAAEDGGPFNSVFSRTDGIAEGRDSGQPSERIPGKPQLSPQEVDAKVARILGKKRSAPIIETAARAITQLVGIDRATRFAGGKVRQLLDAITSENVKAGVISDYGLPEAVTDRRDMMFGHMRRELRGVENTLVRLSNLTRQEARVAYEWMNNRDADALIAELPEDSQALLKELKQTITQNGKEAVRLGLLDADTFARHDGAYMHRSYNKWELESTKAEKRSRASATKILGDAYKGRGIQDLPLMSAIKNVSPAWWNRKTLNGKADKQLRGQEFVRYERRDTRGFGSGVLSGMTDTGQLGKLLEINYLPVGEPVPAKYGAWHEAGTWAVRDVKGDKVVMWRDFTPAERVKMGEIDEVRFAVAKTLHQMIHDIEVARYFEWVASHYAKPEDKLPQDAQKVEAKESMLATFGKDDWVPVPEVKILGTNVHRYGKLAGLYVPGPIWNDIRNISNSRGNILGETYGAILKAWKISKTALSPAVHLNNVMANFVMADWHDVTARDTLDALAVLVNGKDPANKKIIERFEDAGGTQGMYVLSEIQREQLAPLIDQLRKEVGMADVQKQIGAISILQSMLRLRLVDAYEQAATTKGGAVVDKGIRKMMDVYNSEDTVFRLAAFMKAKREGATDVVAGRAARQSFLDYSINAPWISALRQTAFPFVSFTYRAVPMLLKTIEQKPWKLMKLGLFLGAINALGYAVSGGDEDKERRLLPEEKAGNILGAVAPKLIRMPWNDDFNSPVFLDIRRFVPLGDIVDLGQTHAAVPILPFAVPGGPLAVLAELFANKSQFTGKAITKETDTASEQAFKVADHLYKAFAPNLIGLPGSYATTGVWNAAKGKTDSFGREQSIATAGLSSVGVKLGAYPKDVAVQGKTIDFLGAQKEIKSNIYSAGRELSKKGITQEEFNERVADELAKLGKAADKYREAVR